MIDSETAKFLILLVALLCAVLLLQYEVHEKNLANARLDECHQTRVVSNPTTLVGYNCAPIDNNHYECTSVIAMTEKARGE